MSKKKLIALLMCLMMMGAGAGVMSACGGDNSTDSSVESSSTSGDSSSDSTNENPTVTEYKVKFNSLGGSDVATQSVKNGAKASKPTDPTREGYTFVAWLLNGNVYDFDARVTGDITLTAKWEKNAPTKFTVTFVVEGETFHTAEVETGKKLMKPATDPTRNGYFFDGWLLNDVAYDFETPVTEAFTLTAAWADACTVTFDVGAGTAVDPVVVKEGTTVSAPTTTQAGYYVSGWLNGGESYDFTTPVTNDITLTAVWDIAALNSNQFAVIAGAWNQPGADFITTSGDHEETVITAKLKGDRWRHPAVVLRNLAPKAYYENLLAEGYTNLTFGLTVGGENAANVDDLYVFGKKLATYAKNTDGVYAISLDIQFIVDNYDDYIGELGTTVEAKPSIYADQMFIRWECNDTNKGDIRNYVFTVSNAEYGKGVLNSYDIGVRVNGWNMTSNTTYMNMSVGEKGEMIIGSKFQASATYAPALIVRDLKEVTYYEGLIADGYTHLTFNLAVKGDVSELYVFGKKLSNFAKNSDGGYTVAIPLQHFVTYYETINTIATSKDQVGQASSLSAKFIAWKSPDGDYDSVRDYVFTISNTAYTKGALTSENIGIRINGWNMTSNTSYMTLDMGENGEMIIGTNFQANATYAPALIFRNIQEKSYYESLIANGYTKFTFKLAVEGDVSDLYVCGKALSNFTAEDGVYTITIDTQYFVTYYDTISTIATSKDQVGQASSLAAKFITWKSPADDWASVRNYVFTISDVEFIEAE